jgi:hypothetical protein
MSALGYFVDLGRTVSQSWSAGGRANPDLPDIAAQALRTVEIPGDLDALSLLGDTALGQTDLPPQSGPGDNFGQPPLVVYREDDFYIQALTWMDGTTDIHEHAFDGAFMVLQGKSLHVEHAFAGTDRLAEDRLVVGELTPGSSEVLRPGDVRPIEAGGGFIHALFHLERPTVSIVVRNRSSGLLRPQYTYTAPGLGWDGLWTERGFTRRLQSLDVVVKLDPDEGRRLACEIITTAPLWEAFLVMRYWSQRQPWDDVTFDLIDRFAQRAAVLGELIPTAMAHEVNVRRVLARRGMLHVLHQRVFLALLANLSDSEAITHVLQSLFPDSSPGDLLLDWVAELSSPRLRGVSGLSLAPGRLDQLRAAPVEGREAKLLAEVRTSWGEDKRLAEVLY